MVNITLKMKYLKYIIIVGVVIVLIVIGKRFLEYKVIEISNTGERHVSFVVFNKKLFSDVIELNKFNSISKGIIVDYQTRDSILLDSSFFQFETGKIGDIAFRLPNMLVDSMKTIDNGFNAYAPLSGNNQKKVILYEVVMVESDVEGSFRDYYIKLINNTSKLKSTGYIINERVSDNNASVEIIYTGNDGVRYSRIKIYYYNGYLYIVQFSCPVDIYICFPEYIEVLFLGTGLIDDIEALPAHG